MFFGCRCFRILNTIADPYNVRGRGYLMCIYWPTRGRLDFKHHGALRHLLVLFLFMYCLPQLVCIHKTVEIYRAGLKRQCTVDGSDDRQAPWGSDRGAARRNAGLVVFQYSTGFPYCQFPRHCLVWMSPLGDISQQKWYKQLMNWLRLVNYIVVIIFLFEVHFQAIGVRFTLDVVQHRPGVQVPRRQPVV